MVGLNGIFETDQANDKGAKFKSQKHEIFTKIFTKIWIKDLIYEINSQN